MTLLISNYYKKLAQYGIRGLPHKWITDYLTVCTQRTKINGIFSDTKTISAGCPQGSILSGLSFNFFINEIFNVILLNIEIYLYADDIAFSITASYVTELQLMVNKFFIIYCKWHDNNCTIVNPVKSNCILFNTSAISVELNSHLLNNIDFVKYLGILIDNKLY